MIYQGILVYQVIMVIASLLFLIVVSRGKVTTTGRLMLMVAFLCLFMNAASLMGLTSKTMEAMIVALKLKYVGVAFVGTFFFIFCAKYCNHPIKTWIQVLLQVWNVFVVICVWTMERNTLFYSKMNFVTDHDRVFLDYDYGVIGIINIVLRILQLIGCVCLAVSGWKHGENKKEKDSCKIMFVCALFPLVTAPIQFQHMLEGFEPMSGITTIAIIVFFGYAYFQDMFDISDVAHENIIANMDEPIIIIDTNYGFVEANAKAELIFPSLKQCEKGSLLSEPSLLSYVRTGMMDKMFWKDRVYDVHVDRIYDYNQPLGFSILLTDMTEDYQQMKRIHDLMTETKKADQAKTDFLASMSHEIRTPINSIIGMNEMILRETKEPEVKKYALDVKNAAAMLLSLVNDILDSSKIASGKLSIVPVKYSLEEMVLDLYHMIDVSARQKNLEFKVEVDETLPISYRGDDIRIRQVLINLLTNGVKYTENGYVCLRVTGEVDGDEAVLKFSVKDTGYGIPKEHMKTIFSRFDRIEDEKNHRIEGSGLGLSLSERLLELMGSRIQVESKVGEGSEFYFELRQPILDKTPVGPLKDRVDEQEKKTYTVGFIAPTAHILVVDDNDMNRKVFVNLLKKTKIQVMEASCGRECLELVERNHYDLIFLDHMMPEMDGIETLHRMAGMEKSLCKDTPMIMLTANAISGAREKYLAEGFKDFLAKPIFPEQLEEMIQHYLPEKIEIISNSL